MFSEVSRSSVRLRPRRPGSAPRSCRFADCRPSASPSAFESSARSGAAGSTRRRRRRRRSRACRRRPRRGRARRASRGRRRRSGARATRAACSWPCLADLGDQQVAAVARAAARARASRAATIGKPFRFQSVKPPASGRRARSRARRASSRRTRSDCGRARSRGRPRARGPGRRPRSATRGLPRGTCMRAGDVALVPLVVLADVEEERRRRAEQLARRRPRRSRPDVLRSLALRRHCFQKVVATCSQCRPRARIWTIVATVVRRGRRRDGRDRRPDAATSTAASPSTPPPLFLDLGVRDDAQARDAPPRLAALRGRQARRRAAIFERYRSLEAKIGAAFAAGRDTMPALEALAASPTQPLVALHRGLAALGDGRTTGRARPRSRRRDAAQPDTPSALRADDLLHPKFSPGCPLSCRASVPARSHAARRPPARAPRAHADAGAKIHYGSRSSGSAAGLGAAEFDDAARSPPTIRSAQVAAAVARFDKDDPAAAFSRLGPLTRRFPRARRSGSTSGCCCSGSGDAEGAKRAAPAGAGARPGNAAWGGKRSAFSIVSRAWDQAEER